MLRHATFHAGQNTGTRDILVSKLRKKKKENAFFVTEYKFLFHKHYLIITCLRWQQKFRWSRNYPHFAEPINSLPPSQQSSTSPYRARQTSIVHSQPSYFFNINFNIIILSTTRSYNRHLTVMSSNKNPTCQGCKQFSKNPKVTTNFQTPE
jgi:hypothetical protein